MRIRLILMVLLCLLGLTEAARPTVFSGYAVYYNGRRDASTSMTAAHRTLPFGTWVMVKHQRTGRSVLVKINDRGPWDNYQRIIDLAPAPARALGIISEGIAPITLTVLRR
jgi:rare lipoprotein A